MRWKKLLLTTALIFLFQVCYDSPRKEAKSTSVIGRFTIYPSDFHEKRADEIIKNFPKPKP